MKKMAAYIWPLPVVLLAAAIAISVSGCDSEAARGEPVSAEHGNQPDQVAGPEHGAGDYSSSFEPLHPAAAPDPARTARVPVLMYHHVGETPAGADDLRQSLTVSESDFIAQMDYLAQNGYHPITETGLYNALFNGLELPAQAIMLTFDDGYKDNYLVAAPILERYGFHATFFIITDMVGTEETMDWDQVKDLDRQGMDIGSHTVSHPDLTIITVEDAYYELEQSQSAISASLGHPVYWLSYPAGKYDADVLSIARECGYLLAVTTEPGEYDSSDTPFEIYRYRIRSDTSLDEFAGLVK